MATRYITCSLKKQNCGEEREIDGVGGVFGYLEKQTVHDHIKSELHTYYSRAAGAPDVEVYAAGSGPDRYIQTKSDLSKKNNLVNLPDCPR